MYNVGARGMRGFVPNIVSSVIYDVSSETVPVYRFILFIIYLNFKYIDGNTFYRTQ